LNVTAGVTSDTISAGAQSARPSGQTSSKRTAGCVGLGGSGAMAAGAATTSVRPSIASCMLALVRLLLLRSGRGFSGYAPSLCSAAAVRD
jgi:hypothetical protein